ncbi:MAG: GNAT family N-acetyltransferase [Candidatus Altiarchaeota archaeon]
MNFTIRGFERKDAKKVAELHSKFNEWFEDIPIDEEFIIEASLRPDFRIFVAEKDEEIIGFTGLLYYELVGRSEIGPICVRKKHQNKGVGSKLVDMALSFLADTGVHRVVAKVKKGNDKAAQFFKKKGFKKEAMLSKYTRKGEDAVQMVKQLKDI